MMRDRCAGTEFDPLRGCAAVRSATLTMIRPPGDRDQPRRIYDGHPVEERSSRIDRRIVWLALGSQDTSCYVPFYAGLTTCPGPTGWETTGNSAATPPVGRSITPIIMCRSSTRRPSRTSGKPKQVGGAGHRATGEIDRQAGELYAQDPAKAAEFLTGYCLDNARRSWPPGGNWATSAHQVQQVRHLQHRKKNGRAVEDADDAGLVEEDSQGIRCPSRTRGPVGPWLDSGSIIRRQWR